jgi:hypothetical protein
LEAHVAVLNPAEKAALKIDNFIFHVVQHGAPAPILLDQAPIAGFEPFFLDRVRETMQGNRFVFKAGSPTQADLTKIDADPTLFVPTSKELAIRFHRLQDKRIKHGVLIVMALSTGQRKLFSLIKYDHERVLTFELANTRAVLRNVLNSFTESPAALQKSALAELDGATGSLAIVDRTNRTGITNFFQEFLGAARLRTEAALTTRLKDAVIKTVLQHRDVLPADITARVWPKLTEAAKLRGTFDPNGFFADFFGPYGSEAVRATFDAKLEAEEISGEEFAIDLGALQQSGPERYETLEGIQITVPAGAKDTFSYHIAGDATIITIRAGKLSAK